MFKTFLTNAWADIKGFFTNAEQGILSFAASLVHSIAANGGRVLVDGAIAAVAAAETQGGTGQEKLARASAAVVATLRSEGIPVVLNAVNGAIEAAVAALPANVAKAVAAGPAA